MRFIFDNKVEQYRPTLYDYTEKLFRIGDIWGVILPQKTEDLMLTEGVPGEAFRFYCDEHTDLKEADQIKYEGVYYIVKTVRKFRFKSLSRIEAYIYRVKE